MANRREYVNGRCGGVDRPRSEWERAIEEWIFSERDRAILKRRLLDGKTYEALAAEFELSVSQIKRIIQRATQELLKNI